MKKEALSILKKDKYILIDISDSTKPDIHYGNGITKNMVVADTICACIAVLSSSIVGIPRQTRYEVERSKDAILPRIVKAIEGSIEAYILQNNLK